MKQIGINSEKRIEYSKTPSDSQIDKSQIVGTLK